MDSRNANCCTSVDGLLARDGDAQTLKCGVRGTWVVDVTQGKGNERVCLTKESSPEAIDVNERPWTEDGPMVNSGPFDGLSASETKRRITADLAGKGQGKLAVNFKLRDWLFSRQRYWGEPFPLLWVSRADYAKITAAHHRAQADKKRLSLAAARANATRIDWAASKPARPRLATARATRTAS